MEERVEEGATVVAVQADHLAVEDGVAHASERDRDLGSERGKALGFAARSDASRGGSRGRACRATVTQSSVSSMSRRHRAGAMVLSGWLLIGRRWIGVDAWEEVSLRRPFHTQAACEDHRRAKATMVATRGWAETRCVTRQEFAHHYAKSRTGDFEP